jgi:hypothetical protein
MRRTIVALLFMLVLVVACSAEPETVEVTVEVPVEVPVEVTRVVSEVAEVEVTRLVEVEVEVTRLVEHIVTATYTPTPLITPTPSNTPTITPIPTETPVPTNTPTPTSTPTETPTPNIAQTATAQAFAQLTRSRGNGFYLVNIDIAPGIWRSTGTRDDCYWARTRNNGDIIDNHFGMSGGTIFIAASDFQIEFDDCGTWEYLGQ